MQHLIVTTCGTSILTNGAGQEMRAELTRNANAYSAQEWQGDYEAAEKYMNQKCETLLNLPPHEAAKQSAELNSLMAWYQENKADIKRDVHYLVHTDTLQGRMTVDAISSYLQRNFSTHAIPITANKLSTKNKFDFHESLKELTNRLREHLFAPEKKAASKIVFNLTGGFKGLNAYLQVVANLWADLTIVAFEGSELLTIPRLPILPDETVIEQSIVVARRLALGLRVRPQEMGGLPEIFYTVLGDECLSSDIGDFFIKETLPKLYRKKLFPPASQRIIYGEKFEKSLEQLKHSPERLAQLQQRIDDLARCLEKDESLDRLGFKSLKSEKYTHEFYAWSDGSAMRVYANKCEQGYVLEKLGEHL